MSGIGLNKMKNWKRFSSPLVKAISAITGCCGKQKNLKLLYSTNDISIRVSGKLAELFRSSLPRPVNIKFIEVEYSRLKTTLENDDCFQQYHVVLLIKPLGLKLEGVNSGDFRRYCRLQKPQPLSEAFQDELNDEELDQFHQQLLKNFSLQSLMENLTILNPSPLLDSVL